MFKYNLLFSNQAMQAILKLTEPPTPLDKYNHFPIKRIILQEAELETTSTRIGDNKSLT